MRSTLFPLGDMQLTKSEIMATQFIVTTPEKWDVITRKSTGDVELAQKVKLLIIDEVHLLHEDRGAVIESIIARTLRQVRKESGYGLRTDYSLFITFEGGVQSITDSNRRSIGYFTKLSGCGVFPSVSVTSNCRLSTDMCSLVGWIHTKDSSSSIVASVLYLWNNISLVSKARQTRYSPMNEWTRHVSTKYPTWWKKGTRWWSLSTQERKLSRHLKCSGKKC